MRVCIRAFPFVCEFMQVFGCGIVWKSLCICVGVAILFEYSCEYMRVSNNVMLKQNDL